VRHRRHPLGALHHQLHHLVVRRRHRQPDGGETCDASGESAGLRRGLHRGALRRRRHESERRRGVRHRRRVGDLRRRLHRGRAAATASSTRPPARRATPAGESATCDTDCTAASCGDGVVNAAAGEECDEGARQRLPTPAAPTAGRPPGLRLPAGRAGRPARGVPSSCSWRSRRCDAGGGAERTLRGPGRQARAERGGEVRRAAVVEERRGRRVAELDAGEQPAGVAAGADREQQLGATRPGLPDGWRPPATARPPPPRSDRKPSQSRQGGLPGRLRRPTTVGSPMRASKRPTATL